MRINCYFYYEIVRNKSFNGLKVEKVVENTKENVVENKKENVVEKVVENQKENVECDQVCRALPHTCGWTGKTTTQLSERRASLDNHGGTN